MRGPFALELDGRSAVAIELATDDDVGAVPDALGLPTPRPTVALVGGASAMKRSTAAAAQSLLTRALVPVIEEVGGVVVDGGTDAGVMRAAGAARAQQRARFPLVGVVVARLLRRVDGGDPKAAPAESRHSHFVLVPGSRWGDESAWLAAVAGAFAGSAPSVTLLLEGGSIAWQDVEVSIASGRPVIALAGSGRTADALVEAVEGRNAMPGASTLATSGLVRVALFDAADEVEDALRRELAAPRSHHTA